MSIYFVPTNNYSRFNLESKLNQKFNIDLTITTNNFLFFFWLQIKKKEAVLLVGNSFFYVILTPKLFF